MARRYQLHTLHNSIVARHGHPTKPGIHIRGAEFIRYLYNVPQTDTDAESVQLVSYLAVSVQLPDSQACDWKVLQYQPL